MSGIRSSPLAALCVDDVTRARNENIHTSERTSQNQHRPVFVAEPTEPWKKSALLWNIIPLQRFQGRGQRLSTGPPESERFSMVAHEHKDSPTSCNRSHDPVQLDGHQMV